MTGDETDIQKIEEEWGNTDILAGEELPRKYIDDLIQLAGSEDPEDVRSAVRILHDVADTRPGNLSGHVRELTEITSELDEEEEWEVVDSLLSSIGSIARSDPESATSAYELLFEYHTQEPPYRSTAANALPYFVTLENDLIESLIERIKNPAASNRKQSAFVLRKIAEGHPDKILPETSVLFELAVDSKGNVDVTKHCLQTLAEVAKEYPDEISPYVGGMSDLLNDQDRYKSVRGEAARVLAIHAEQYPEALDDDLGELADLLNDDEDNVRWHVAELFREVAANEPGKLTGVASDVQALCFDEYDNVRDVSLETLVYLVEADVVGPEEVNVDQDNLISLVDSSTAATMAATLPSIKLLGYVADSGALPCLERVVEAETGTTPEEKEATRQAIERIQEP